MATGSKDEEFVRPAVGEGDVVTNVINNPLGTVIIIL